jgi:hypothetical protein
MDFLIWQFCISTGSFSYRISSQGPEAPGDRGVGEGVACASDGGGAVGPPVQPSLTPSAKTEQLSINLVPILAAIHPLAPWLLLFEPGAPVHLQMWETDHIPLDYYHHTPVMICPWLQTGQEKKPINQL